MAFAVEEFEDLLRLLRERPEWKAELRRELLGDELLELPELVRQNTVAIGELRDAQARTEATLRAFIASTEARFEAIDRRFDAVDERFDAVDKRFDAVDERFDAVDERFVAIDRRFDRVERELGDVKGLTLATWFTDRPHLIARGLRRPATVAVTEVLDLDELVGRGALSEEENVALRSLDLLVAGRAGQGEDAHEAYLAVEISGVIDERDVARARQRAAILKKLGLDARPVVAGTSINVPGSEAAKGEDVAVVLRPAR